MVLVPFKNYPSAVLRGWLRLSLLITLIFCTVLEVAFDKAMAREDVMTPTSFFNQANYENLEHVCRKFYADDIQFIDPLGEIKGIDNMISYYKNLYENVISIRFDEMNTFERDNEKVLVWQMHLKHKKVGGGDPIVLDGVSVFRYQGSKVIYHRDYFDLGAMIYEKIPILGSLIRWIRTLAHGQS